MLSLPKNWFELEYFKELRKKVRGPISRNRRLQCTFKKRVPKRYTVVVYFSSFLCTLISSRCQKRSWGV